MVFPRKTTCPAESRQVYFKDGGLDSQPGVSQETGVQSIAQAITLANNLTPTGNDPVTINSDSGAIYDESFTLPDDVFMDAPSIQDFNSDAVTVTLGSNNQLNVRQINNSHASGTSLRMTQPLSIADVVALTSAGVCLEFTNLAAAVDCNIEFIATNGVGAKGISNATTSGLTQPIAVDVSSILLGANNTIAVENSATTTPLSGYIGSIYENNPHTGTTGVKVTGGAVNLTISRVAADTAIDCDGGHTNILCPDIEGDITVASGAKLDLITGHITGDITVDAGGELSILCVDFDGTLTNNGTINGNIEGQPYGTWAEKIGLDETVIVNEESDLPAPSAGVITLDNTKIYQVVGDVVLTNNLDLNGTTITGSSRQFDKLTSTTTNQTMFVGGTSGTVQNLYIASTGTGAKVFNTTGTNIQNLAFDTCSFNGNTDLGTVSDFYALQFTNCVFQNNAAGLTATDITKFSHNDTSWIQNNTATTQLTLTGTFDVILFSGAGMGVPTTKTALSVAGITSVTSFGQIDGGFAFNGAGTYVDDLTVFEDPEWSVEAYGIDQIYKDIQSFGNLSKDASSTTTITTVNTPVKISGATTLNSNFRMGDGSTDNRIVNNTNSRLAYTITGQAGVDNTGGAADAVSLYVAIDGTVDTASQSPGNVGSALAIQNIGINHTFYLDPASYAEVWIENNDDTTDLVVARMNYTLKP